MLKRFIRYYRPHRLIFWLDMLAALGVAGIGVLYPMVTRRMLNEYIPNKEYKMIAIMGAVLLTVYLARMGLNFFMQYYGHVMGVRMQRQMRTDLFHHMETLPYSFYDNNETGKLMSRLTNDLFDVSELAHHGPENLIISAISIVVSFIYLSTINWGLTLIIFACTPFLLAISLTLRRKMRSAFKRSRESVAEINAAMEGSISGIRVTKAFNNAEKEEEKFDVGNQKFVAARTDAYRAMGQFHSATTFITDIFNVVVLVAGGFFLYGNQIGLGDYSAFVVSIHLFITPVMTLINFMEQYQDGVTGFERFVEIMDTPSEADSEGAVDMGRAKGKIEFCNVSYAYDGKHDVLCGVNLNVEAGKKFALVGPSGGGKTTICHLIPHFYDVESGEIRIDDRELHSITLHSLRQNIGIVQQDVYLFNSTIRENILYGRLDATDEEVYEAAKRANIHDYILSLPNGYETQIGERGVKLSGGQKQRLSIARVFLKDPPILILDEATSALDNATEIQIQKALEELCRGRTTIIVAHRLSTVKNADEIAVIEKGKITEQGTHEELIAQNGVYATLYRMQFRASDF